MQTKHSTDYFGAGVEIGQGLIVYQLKQTKLIYLNIFLCHSQIFDLHFRHSTAHYNITFKVCQQLHAISKQSHSVIKDKNYRSSVNIILQTKHLKSYNPWNAAFKRAIHSIFFIRYLPKLGFYTLILQDAKHNLVLFACVEKQSIRSEKRIKRTGNMQRNKIKNLKIQIPPGLVGFYAVLSGILKLSVYIAKVAVIRNLFYDLIFYLRSPAFWRGGTFSAIKLKDIIY